jgi:hypothetical protein
MAAVLALSKLEPEVLATHADALVQRGLSTDYFVRKAAVGAVQTSVYFHQIRTPTSPIELVSIFYRCSRARAQRLHDPAAARPRPTAL